MPAATAAKAAGPQWWADFPLLRRVNKGWCSRVPSYPGNWGQTAHSHINRQTGIGDICVSQLCDDLAPENPLAETFRNVYDDGGPTDTFLHEYAHVVKLNWPRADTKRKARTGIAPASTQSGTACASNIPTPPSSGPAEEASSTTMTKQGPKLAQCSAASGPANRRRPSSTGNLPWTPAPAGSTGRTRITPPGNANRTGHSRSHRAEPGARHHRTGAASARDGISRSRPRRKIAPGASAHRAVRSSHPDLAPRPMQDLEQAHEGRTPAPWHPGTPTCKTFTLHRRQQPRRRRHSCGAAAPQLPRAVVDPRTVIAGATIATASPLLDRKAVFSHFPAGNAFPSHRNKTQPLRG